MPPKTRFPLGLAKGSAFCNRVQERERLRNNALSGRHTLIISPRRYGKSSLAVYTINELKWPHARVDLFIAIDEHKISTEILDGVKTIFNQVSKKHERLIQTLKTSIQKLKLKLIVGTDGVNIEIIPTQDQDHIKNIQSALLLLEYYLAIKKQKAILFIDEFQEVGAMAHSRGIEGAIRHIAQESEYLIFIFSGSSRHLLSQIFDDRSKPLYKLCDRMHIDRIHQDDYQAFIQNIAYQTWRRHLPNNIIDAILHLTERHPYYVNLLCSRIWATFQDKLPATSDVITNIWTNIAQEQKTEAGRELSGLSELQKKLLVSIATGRNQNLTGKQALTTFNASSAAVIKGLNVLADKDYIYQIEDHSYRLIDPLIKTIIDLAYD